jgi:two-component system response regulator MprA
MAHILVIDDNPAVLDTVCDMLATAGHAAEGALDGIAGLEKFQRAKFDVVISDIFMPREDGIGTIRKIRRTDPSVGIIAISGGAVIGTADEALRMSAELGADFTLLKPITRPVLLETVMKAQRKVAQNLG